MYKLLNQEGKARRGEFETPHGVVQTPVFMNVGTQGAIKGALSAEDLENIFGPRVGAKKEETPEVQEIPEVKEEVTEEAN